MILLCFMRRYVVRYVVLCCKTRVTYTHTQVSRGGILKVASECRGTESTHSKLRLWFLGKPGLDFDFNLK